MTAAKIAITVPPETLGKLERKRKKLGLTRSAAVVAAVEAWLVEQDMTDAERRYILGYLRHPETEEEVRSSESFLSATSWEPWDASPKRKRTRSSRRGRK